jgi:hypothetical protein
MAKKILTQSVLALLVPPILFVIYESISYALARRTNQLPGTYQPDWIFWAAFVLSLAFGTFIVARSTSGKLRVLLLVLYLPLMVYAMLWAGVLTACFNGDCI